MPKFFSSLRYLQVIIFFLCIIFFQTGNCPAALAANSTFRIGSDYWATVGSTVAIDVSIENPQQLYGCEFELRYDEDIVRARNVTKGELLTGDYTLDADLSEAEDGKITIYWFNEYQTPVPYGGVLFRIYFRVLDEGSTALSVRDLDLFEKYNSGSAPYIIDGTISTWGSGDTSPHIYTNSYLPGATRDSWYSVSLSAGGGRTPYTWSRTGGSLPPGLSLDSTGKISGMPTSIGNYSATIRVTDENGRSTSRTFYITVYDIGEDPLTITSSATLPRGRKGSYYSTTLSAGGGRTPYTWSRTGGSLPPGLSLDSTGKISGTPTSTGRYTFTTRVRDNNNARQEQEFHLTITDTDYISSAEDLFKTLTITRSTMNLDLSPENMPYTMVVSNDINYVNLTVTLYDAGDRLRINGSSSYDGRVRTVPLKTGTNLITVEVSSGGSTFRSFALIIYRLP